MKNEQGFSLVELLIVVAIIAIIAAIAVPSLLTSRMAANESGGIQGCRTVASAEVAFAATNNQNYAPMADLVTGNFLDNRFTSANGFNGYTYTEDIAVVGFDDSYLTHANIPPLTTVRSPIEELGRKGMQQLVQLIQTRKAESKILLPTELIVRRSCGCNYIERD